MIGQEERKHEGKAAFRAYLLGSGCRGERAELLRCAAPVWTKYIFTKGERSASTARHRILRFTSRWRLHRDAYYLVRAVHCSGLFYIVPSREGRERDAFEFRIRRGVASCTVLAASCCWICSRLVSLTSFFCRGLAEKGGRHFVNIFTRRRAACLFHGEEQFIHKCGPFYSVFSGTVEPRTRIRAIFRRAMWIEYALYAVLFRSWGADQARVPILPLLGGERQAKGQSDPAD